MKSRLSYNVNGQALPDESYFLAHITKLQPTVILIMDNLPLADKVYKLFGGKCIVVNRSWSSLEGDEWAKRPVADWIATWKREGYPHIVRSTTNEPSYGIATIKAFIQHSVDLCKAAREAGFTLAVGNYSVGRFQQNEIEAGFYDPLLRAIHDYGHYGAAHEYTACCLPFGVGQIPSELLKDRLAVQPRLWPKKEQIAALSQDYPPFWHLLRYEWFLRRCDKIGVPRHKVILTEFAWDNVSDIAPVLRELSNKYGLDKYMRDMRGVNSYKNLWGYYWPDWSTESAAYQQLAWADSIYPKDYIGFCMFTWSNHPHWTHSDFSGQAENWQYQLHKLLEAHTSPTFEDSPMPSPIPPPSPVPSPPELKPKRVRRSEGQQNIRASKNLTATIVGVIAQDWIDMDISETTERVGSHDWYTLKLNGQIAYTAKLPELEIAEREVPPPAPLPTPIPTEDVYEVNLYQMTIRGSLHDMDVYATVFETLAGLFRNAKKLD